jgi:hypothetical protein
MILEEGGIDAADAEGPLLEIELMEIPNGCLARLSGDLIWETRAGLPSIEPMMANETRVTLDVSGLTSIDRAGLEAALRLICAIHAFGGTVLFGGYPSDEVGVAFTGALERHSLRREPTGHEVSAR